MGKALNPPKKHTNKRFLKTLEAFQRYVTHAATYEEQLRNKIDVAQAEIGVGEKSREGIVGQKGRANGSR